MEVPAFEPLTFPPSSYITQLFERRLQTPSASPSLRRLLAESHSGAATTSQAAGPGCWAPKHKDPVVADSVASIKALNKHDVSGQAC